MKEITGMPGASPIRQKAKEESLLSDAPLLLSPKSSKKPLPDVPQPSDSQQPKPAFRRTTQFLKQETPPKAAPSIVSSDKQETRGSSLHTEKGRSDSQSAQTRLYN